MGSKVQLFLVLLASCLLFVSCATDTAVKQENAALKAQLIEMQKSIADVNLRLEELSNSVFILQERTKANKQALNHVTQPKIIIQESNAAEYNLEAAQTNTTPLPQGGMEQTDSTPVAPKEQGAYLSAKASFDKQNYGLAVFDFTSFLSNNPQDANADDARFFLGLSYYRLNEYSQAVREWNKYLAQYPAGDKAGQATYRTGMAYKAMGDATRAKIFFDLTLQKYPETEWAKAAAEALKR